MKRTAIIIAALLLFASSAVAQQSRPQRRGEMETYLYAVKGNDTLYVDRHYDPEKIKPGKIPTMIYMYGGGWAFGSRRGNFSYLTDIGVQVFSIDYRKGLTKYGYNPSPEDEMYDAVHMALDDLTDAMAYVLAHAEEFNVDTGKVMLSGSSAGGINTLMAVYDICNDGPYSRKFPEGWMPAGYIGYAGGVMTDDTELVWKKKPCPMMFFHGSADTSVNIEKVVRPGRRNNMFGPKYIIPQLEEMDVPYWLYCEIDGDHVLSYKAFSGYNTNEIQTFVQKFVLQGLPLRMKTEEYNMVEPSHLPGTTPVR